MSVTTYPVKVEENSNTRNKVFRWTRSSGEVMYAQANGRFAGTIDLAEMFTAVDYAGWHTCYVITDGYIECVTYDEEIARLRKLEEGGVS